MDNTTDAHSVGENRYTDTAVRSRITPWGGWHLIADGRAVRVLDANYDTPNKRRGLALPRYERAVSRWGLDATVYEYRLDLTQHLDARDVLDLDDNAQMWAFFETLAPDAFIKLEDVRTSSPLPVAPHAHFVTTALLPDMPGLWRHPEPLDLHTLNLSDDTTRTLYGWFWYAAKPILGGAARPSPKQYRQLRQRFEPEDFVRQQLAAHDRMEAAQARVEARGRKALPVALGWVIGGRKRRKRAA